MMFIYLFVSICTDNNIISCRHFFMIINSRSSFTSKQMGEFAYLRELRALRALRVLRVL